MYISSYSITIHIDSLMGRARARVRPPPMR